MANTTSCRLKYFHTSEQHAFILALRIKRIGDLECRIAYNVQFKLIFRNSRALVGFLVKRKDEKGLEC